MFHLIQSKIYDKQILKQYLPNVYYLSRHNKTTCKNNLLSSFQMLYSIISVKIEQYGP